MDKTEIKLMEDNFHKYCGEVLRMGLAAEAQLEFFITKYSTHPEREFIVRDILILNIPFGKKISLFKEICRKENMNEKEVIETVDHIRHVNEIRNKVAHWESAIINWKEGIRLQQPESVKNLVKDVILTPTIIREVDNHRLAAIKSMNKIYLKLVNSTKQ